MMDRSALVRLMAGLVAGGRSIAAAVHELEMLPIPRTLLEDARLDYEKEVARIRSLRIPRTLEGDAVVSAWYAGPRDGDVFWPPLRSLLERQGLNAAAVDTIDRSSTRIVSLLAPPGAATIRTRGLVLGHVQSGKTTSFTAVAAKAADAGYRLIVVLSGIHNSLRRQTQLRLDESLVKLNEKNWFTITTADDDFADPGNPNALLGNPDLRVLAVVKKNQSRLSALLGWLGGVAPQVLAACPILVIDDEADQASLDTSDAHDATKRTRINELIVRVLRLPKAAYVGYTATPYANLFVDPVPEDLYPRDFIVDLPKPEGHVGTETIFGRERLVHEDDDAEFDGWDVVRLVPDDELAALHPPRARAAREGFEPLVTPSLREAIRYFILATAARATRGDAGRHSTMLVHTTVFTDVHERMEGPVRAEVEDVRRGVSGNKPELIADLRALWKREQKAFPPSTVNEQPVAFDVLLREVGRVLERLDVVVDNYKAVRRLIYDDVPRAVIVIGGNTLSRGLTLEGLVVSFFIRTANAYDTLLQMGRWFGYRRGYADLPRIWMTAELSEWFNWLATVEQEIRNDIERYEKENLTPLQFAVRIRTHPKMAITSAAKMQRAIDASVSYEGRRIQTILFKHRDRAWLAGNLVATRALVAGALSTGARAQEIGRGRWMLSDVPVDTILLFLAGYRFHEDSYDLRSDLVTGYIADQNRLGDLRKWNIVVMGQGGDTELGKLDLGLPERVQLINRSRLDTPGQPHANIKALMSKVDRVVDLGLDEGSLAGRSEEELVEMRPPGIGLLLLYPISGDSRPMRPPPGGKKARVALGAVDHMMGVGLVFPAARDSTPQSYKSADLSGVEQEEYEIEPDDEATARKEG